MKHLKTKYIKSTQLIHIYNNASQCLTAQLFSTLIKRKSDDNA